ncbi:arsenite efflux membrane protein ArsB (TC 3.A.4.1.1 TC 2.A.45.1.1) [Micromonospora matsumotoense]|uniref:Arsenite efflux membrane protein ArsB (TC 3.A.4.1.1 TC 2.A.45.1.1) n=1 Tax=Micromonospora matsumotoense TaxID=121616 RepID=A0A1C5AF95_9ACTN|nr:SLC13 family permease [Micromonospora matsumotoense]SCF43895.1 arsenite efflux membrane protein ArsB (TC 3.A.4.1.1 TC 2.A.45.1.1) [Micromonospora matsumotoense]
MTPAGGTPPVPTDRPRRPRLHPLDRVAIGLALLGLGAVVTGLLPRADAAATLHRVLPLLLFLGAVVVLAELTAVAGVFDVLATRLAIVARGSFAALFLLCVGFASLTTIALNLDTTAVLLTPVMIALARKLGVAPGPLAMTTVWLANTASLLLPVSNLTNLLAADRIALAPAAYAARMALPQVAAIGVTMAGLWLWYWRRGRRDAERFTPPPPYRPADRLLFGTAVAGCLLLVGGILAGVEIGVAAAVAAGLVVLGFLVRSRRTLRPALLPWRLLVFVTGLFLVVQTLGRHGLDDLVSVLLGDAGGTVGALRAGGTGAFLANLVNNLPAYLAGEAVLPPGDETRLLALLIGTNVGPLAVPWASLATLLWFERCRAAGVTVPWGRFVATSAVVAVLATVAAVLALLVVG